MPDGSGRPRMVLGSTVKGKGVSFMEDRHEWHYGVCTPEMTQAALEEIEAEEREEREHGYISR